MEEKKILVIGACGHLGSELLKALRKKYGREQVLASDMLEARLVRDHIHPYRQVDARDKTRLLVLCRQEKVTEIYLLAALLPISEETNKEQCWQSGVEGLLNVLDIGVACSVKRVFWPSSIAVFGKDAPKLSSPQINSSYPATAYGVSKVAGEYWCRYYFEKYGLDVRSIRYPGLISPQYPAGKGTTNYPVEMFHHAVSTKDYICFLKPGTILPMMYMADAVRAAMELMEAPAERITVRTAYNLDSMSFSPDQLGEKISGHIDCFRLHYLPDFRQQIAESFPSSLDGQRARADWGWAPKYGLNETVEVMLTTLRKRLQIS
ncbi:NAD-dependent epimerase [Pedobacter kyungheensis]|uniref:NAD-dependent epimerase n=1 Tax=Pedobacter kyungheensis TaxID=1069985 RepID=A0A0C1DR58_9SPHI|nr:NAD-dependent epimerase/dehydratase family protein [Pedobacter kyungheensis]KIA96545.1 NAD-dependent epimerase [Pedobacter kyungheensis]